ncbi:hypothetical protein CO611_06640 [Lysobacteraceae bacterium NML03-0222]|nr:hypothetical protein CO611_06640 [Xanthomonadaceae bacterium NML03-0222]
MADHVLPMQGKFPHAINQMAYHWKRGKPPAETEELCTRSDRLPACRQIQAAKNDGNFDGDYILRLLAI